MARRGLGSRWTLIGFRQRAEVLPEGAAHWSATAPSIPPPQREGFSEFDKGARAGSTRATPDTELSPLPFVYAAQVPTVTIGPLPASDTDARSHFAPDVPGLVGKVQGCDSSLDFGAQQSVSVDARDAPSAPPAGPTASASGLRSVGGRASRAAPDRRTKTMPKLSDTQAVLLAAAAARSDRSVLPAPETLKLKGAALAQSLKALRGRGLIAEAPSESRGSGRSGPAAPRRRGGRNRLTVTPAGLAAIGSRRRRRTSRAAKPRSPAAPLPHGRREGTAGSAGWQAGDAARRGRASGGRDPRRADGGLGLAAAPPAPPSVGCASAATTCASPAWGRARPITCPGRLMRRRVTQNGGAEFAPPPPQPLQARIAALAELPIAELRQAWSAARGAPPPKGARRRLLMLGIAWTWQAELEGGFSSRSRRATLEAAFRQGGAPKLNGHGHSRPRLLPGARLIRIGRPSGTRCWSPRAAISGRPELGLALVHRPRDHRHPPQWAGLLRPAQPAAP